MLRLAPFVLIWLVGVPFLIWLMVAPRVADPRYWQVDQVDIKLGSSQVFNPAEAPPATGENKSLADAAKSAALPPPKTQMENADSGITPPPRLSPDGVKINPLNPDLQEDSAAGPIPKISGERAAWQYYARPFSADEKRPRLAIIIKDVGLSRSALQDSIAALPGAISFAFSPYADDASASMQSARDAGHETLLEMPLELPPGSTHDNGTLTISSAQTSSVNEDNFLKLLSRMLGCVGVITTGGERLVNNEAMLRPLMQNLLARGLLMVDDTQQNETLSPLIAEQLKAPWARTLFTLDDTLSQDAIESMMVKAAQAAKANGSAIVVAGPSALTRTVLARWIKRLEHDGVALAPISAVTTLGSAAATSALPAATEPVPSNPAPPGVMQPPAEAPAAESADIAPNANLLNQNTVPATVPNILDPSKPAH